MEGLNILIISANGMGDDTEKENQVVNITAVKLPMPFHI